MTTADGHFGSKVPLYFEEYQDVRQALARAEGALGVILAVCQRQRKLAIRIEGVEETIDEVKEASATLAAAYSRHLTQQVKEAESHA